jgi:hypothetical protein
MAWKMAALTGEATFNVTKQTGVSTISIIESYVRPLIKSLPCTGPALIGM